MPAKSPPARRPDMKALWDAFWDKADDVNRVLKEDFLHFTAGTSTSEVTEWFERTHAELDRREEHVVEILTPGFLRPKAHRFTARHVRIDGDGVAVDGVERPELRDKLIVGIQWLSGRGSVEADTSARIRGMVNGVAVNTTHKLPAKEEDEPSAPRML